MPGAAISVQAIKKLTHPMFLAKKPVGADGNSHEAAEQRILCGGKLFVGNACHECDKSGGPHSAAEILKSDNCRQQGKTVTHPRQNRKTGGGYGLEKPKNPQASVDLKAEHDHPADQSSCHGRPEAEQFYYGANLGF